MKRMALLMIGVLALLAANGCCCTHSLFGSSYAPTPAPPYYAAPPTAVIPAAQPQPVYTQAPVVQQPQCPCTCQ